jgi:peptidoglycan/LPS O-acetylase OafA/YrhL
MTLKYRPDIDGLRGISVLAVVLFHARIPGFGGGFVGVDVFFVISGFLITSILRARTRGDFALVSFYERRIRRLFPALFCVLIFCTGASAILLLPDELTRFGNSLIATSLFLPNFFFWRQTAYFAPISENAPLLHMWSLGVEEQFYIFYPITFALINRFFPKNALSTIAVFALASFMISLWAVEHHPSAAFYLPPTRAWELLLGGMVALMPPPRFNNVTRESAAIAGLLLIVSSITILSGESTFPGLNALAPCIGTALIVYAGITGPTIVTRFLSIRPIVFVGLISYSLYLWHWPLFALSRNFAIRNLNIFETGGLIISAVLLSVLSWKYVERPFRKTDGVLNRHQLFQSSVSIVALMVFAGGLLALLQGMPERVSPEVRRLESSVRDSNPDRARCHSISPVRIRAGELCELGKKLEGDPDFIVWGDSHADAMMPAFKNLAIQNKKYGLFASYTSCPPLLGDSIAAGPYTDQCRAFNDAMLSVVERYKSSRVILIASWNHYLKSNVLTDNRHRDHLAKRQAFQRGLIKTVDTLSANRNEIWVIQQVPAAAFDLPVAAAMAEHRGIDKNFLRPVVSIHDTNTSVLNEIFEEARVHYNLHFIDPKDILCAPHYCDIEHEGELLYRDFHHLSNAGARYLTPGLNEIFSN